MGFLLKALRVRQNAGDHAAHRVRHRHSGDFAAGEDEVAQRELLIHALIQKALVHPLVVAADQNQMVVAGLEFLGGLLVKVRPQET